MKRQNHSSVSFHQNRTFLKHHDGRTKVRQVVISRLQDPLKYDSHSFNQFIQELNTEYTIQENLLHQNIVKNLSFYYENSSVVLTQEYYDCFLHELPLRYLNFEKRIKIFYGICQGVKHLHDSRVCHGALSSQCISILVQNKIPKAKINCFSSAIMLEQKISEADSSTLKSNSYSSPEVKRGAKYGLRADIYSLGVILNYILYETLQNIWQKEKQTHIQVPEGTPDWLLELLKSMLQYEEKKRYCIEQVLDILKVSLKCLQVLSKHIPLGNQQLALNKKASSKIKWLQQ